MSSGHFDKYEYLTGEGLDYKPSAVEKKGFEYSSLGKVFNKGLDKDGEKEGLLKRLKNIEDKNQEQLKAIKDKTCLKYKLIYLMKSCLRKLLLCLKKLKTQEIMLITTNYFLQVVTKRSMALRILRCLKS